MGISSTLYLTSLATWKAIQDSLAFWIPRRGFWIPDSMSVELGFWIPILRGIPDFLRCIPESEVRIPLQGATRQQPVKFDAWFSPFDTSNLGYFTIISRARMGSESIAHEAESRMGYWLRGHEGERNNCFSKIQLVGQKYRDKATLAS